MNGSAILMKTLIALLVVLAVATLPVWPYSRRWGWTASAAIGLIALLVLVLLLNYVV